MPRKPDNTMCGKGKHTGLYCKACGEFIPFPVGVMEWAAGVAKLFARIHRQCVPGAETRHPMCTFQIEEGPEAARFGKFKN